MARQNALLQTSEPYTLSYPSLHEAHFLANLYCLHVREVVDA